MPPIRFERSRSGSPAISTSLSRGSRYLGEVPVRMEIRAHGQDSAPAQVTGGTLSLAPDRPAAGRLEATRCASTQREEPVLHRRLAWAELLQRIFEVDALGCPRCGGRMRVLSAITDRTVAARILHCLALPSRAPPLGTSLGGKGPSESVEEALPDSILEFDFDQSPSYDDSPRSD